jgi:hypothetical protein
MLLSPEDFARSLKTLVFTLYRCSKHTLWRTKTMRSIAVSAPGSCVRWDSTDTIKLMRDYPSHTQDAFVYRLGMGDRPQKEWISREGCFPRLLFYYHFSTCPSERAKHHHQQLHDASIS